VVSIVLFPLCLLAHTSAFADICLLSLIFIFCVSAEKVGVSLEPLQQDNEDPLTAAVDLLESNWKLVQEVLQLSHRVLTRMFVRLWPKKRAEMPVDDLKKLAAAFDTVENLILTMKS
jgi:hypothetical protein